MSTTTTTTTTTSSFTTTSTSVSTISTFSSSSSSSSSSSTLSTLSSLSTSSSSSSSLSTLSSSSTSTSTCTTHSTTTTSLPEEKSIRELVIDQIKTKIQEISQDNYYRNNITTVSTGLVFYGKYQLPAISILPGMENPKSYQSVRHNAMSVAIIAFIGFDPKIESASIKGEPLLADIIHNILGPVFQIRFLLGEHEPSTGTRLHGLTSHATVRVMSVSVTSGDWGLKNAGGIIRVRDMRGLLQRGEVLMDDGGVTIALANLIESEPKYGGYVSKVDYITGGIQGYPEAGEDITAVSTTFSFVYPTLNDNPYLMP